MANDFPPVNDPWQKEDGAAHPNSPAGGGGPGYFKGQLVRGGETDLWDPIPDPQAPAARSLVSGDEKPEALEATPLQATTKPSTAVKKDETKTVGGNKVTIKKDSGPAQGSTGDATTAFDIIPGKFPGFHFNKDKKIDKLEGPVPVATATIQTTYTEEAKPEYTQGYGRGTTKADKANDDTTIGFHESCHRKDYIDYLTNHPLPTFTFAADGTKTEADFIQAQIDYGKAIEAYKAAAEKETIKNTDEVGDPTLTIYKIRHP